VVRRTNARTAPIAAFVTASYRLVRDRVLVGSRLITDHDAPSHQWHHAQRQQVCRASIASFPADLSVRSQVAHCITRLLEFVQNLGDESIPAFGGRASFSLFARNIYPEFQPFGHPQFHFLQPVRRMR
jgi:hypothetical protein